MVWSLLIVDDRPEFRRAARELLSSETFVVVGVAAGALEALTMAGALEPDVVLLDIKLPDGDGFAVAETLAALDPHPAVVLTSSHRRAGPPQGHPRLLRRPTQCATGCGRRPGWAAASPGAT
jgi:CheY-like chemotaxis protein